MKQDILNASIISILKQKRVNGPFGVKEFVLTPDEMELQIMMVEEMLRLEECDIETMRSELISKQNFNSTLINLTNETNASALDIQEHYLAKSKEILNKVKQMVILYKNNRDYNQMLEDVLKLQK